MKIIEDIIESLTDKSNTLTDILIKTKVLAFKLKNQELQNWIDSELNGYDEKEELPKYRILSCEIMGTISNGFKQAKNYPIPLTSVSADLRKGMKTVKMSQSISALDEFIRKEKGSKMYMHVPPEMYDYMSRDFEGGFVIEYARREIDRVQVIETLTSVKSKLLDFLLKLNQEIGDEKISDLNSAQTNDLVSSLFNSSVFGNNTTIIVGDNNKQNVKNITKGNFESLKKEFIENDIDESDLNELKEIIDNDNPDIKTKQFGSKVKGWMSKMMIKSMDGTWKVGIGAAGKVLADGIGTYYGWK
jgi:hypothetical protein